MINKQRTGIINCVKCDPAYVGRARFTVEWFKYITFYTLIFMYTGTRHPSHHFSLSLMLTLRSHTKCSCIMPRIHRYDSMRGNKHLLTFMLPMNPNEFSRIHLHADAFIYYLRHRPSLSMNYYFIVWHQMGMKLERECVRQLFLFLVLHGTQYPLMHTFVSRTAEMRTEKWWKTKHRMR